MDFPEDTTEEIGSRNISKADVIEGLKKENTNSNFLFVTKKALGTDLSFINNVYKPLSEKLKKTSEGGLMPELINKEFISGKETYRQDSLSSQHYISETDSNALFNEFLNNLKLAETIRGQKTTTDWEKSRKEYVDSQTKAYEDSGITQASWINPDVKAEIKMKKSLDPNTDPSVTVKLSANSHEFTFTTNASTLEELTDGKLMSSIIGSLANGYVVDFSDTNYRDKIQIHPTTLNRVKTSDFVLLDDDRDNLNNMKKFGGNAIFPNSPALIADVSTNIETGIKYLGLCQDLDGIKK